MNLVEIMQVYEGSNGDATKALYEKLAKFGPIGIVATNLFRACKASERAKKYRGGGYRGKAYEKKDWSIGNLCDALRANAAGLNITWGWGRDERTIGFENVLYVDIPGCGQVSFHNSRRYENCPDYDGKWDETHGKAPSRISTWIARIFDQNNIHRCEAANG
jgi:hypothetical protein